MKMKHADESQQERRSQAGVAPGVSNLNRGLWILIFAFSAMMLMAALDWSTRLESTMSERQIVLKSRIAIPGDKEHQRRKDSHHGQMNRKKKSPWSNTQLSKLQNRQEDTARGKKTRHRNTNDGLPSHPPPHPRKQRGRETAQPEGATAKRPHERIDDDFHDERINDDFHEDEQENIEDISVSASQPWPTLFYLGAPKTGSTSLWNLLRQHPHVCGARNSSNIKEPDFFLDRKKYSQGPQAYVSMFAGAPKCEELTKKGQKRYYIDASVKYIFGRMVPKRMKEMIPASLHDSLRFVAVFREPVDRDRSWAGQLAKITDDEKVMELATDEGYLRGLKRRMDRFEDGERSDIRNGFYELHVAEYLKEFKREQFLFLNFDTMIMNETDSLTRIMNHYALDIEPIQDDLRLPQVNVRKDGDQVTPLRDLDADACSDFAEVYTPHLEALYQEMEKPGFSRWQPPFPRFQHPCQIPTLSEAKVVELRKEVHGGKGQPWPTLFYLGAPKTGSTSLWNLLRKHPHVCGAKNSSNIKEPDFFLDRKKYSQGPQAYVSMFAGAPKCEELTKKGQKRYYIDASVKYIFNRMVPKRMKEMIPASLHDSLRFVAVFREPVDRDRSWAGQKAKITDDEKMKELATDEGYLRDLKKRMDRFEDGERTDIRNGFYDLHVAEYVKEFKREQFLFLNFDTMIMNETDSLTRIMNHLGLDLEPIQDDLRLPQVNVRKDGDQVTPLRDLDADACSDFAEVYTPHLEALYQEMEKPGFSRWQPPFPRFQHPCQIPTLSEAKVVELRKEVHGDKWNQNATPKSNHKPVAVAVWPKGILLGVPGAASKALAAVLQKHPRVCTGMDSDGWDDNSPIRQFFMEEELRAQGSAGYLAMFEESAKSKHLEQKGITPYYLEVGQGYLRGSKVPRFMTSTFPERLHEELRFVVVLREPVARDRAWAAFKWLQSHVDLEEESEAYVKDFPRRMDLLEQGKKTDIRHGFYHDQLRHFLETFKRSQFLVLNFNTLIDNEQESLRRIAMHLGLDPKPFQTLELPQVNEHADAKPLGSLNKNYCRRLSEVYAPDMEKLYQLLQEPGFSQWQPAFPLFQDPCRDQPPANDEPEA